jgi:hypothetical protein
VTTSTVRENRRQTSETFYHNVLAAALEEFEEFKEFKEFKERSQEPEGAG